MIKRRLCAGFYREEIPNRSDLSGFLQTSRLFLIVFGKKKAQIRSIWLWFAKQPAAPSLGPERRFGQKSALNERFGFGLQTSPAASWGGRSCRLPFKQQVLKSCLAEKLCNGSDHYVLLRAG